MAYCDKSVAFLSRKNKAKMIAFCAASAIVVSTLTTASILPFPQINSNIYQSALAQNSTLSLSNGTMLTYKNPDIGLTMQYPSSWITQTGNLVRNTIVAFELKQNPFHNSLNFANTSLAEVDLRVYPAAQNLTSAKFSMADIDLAGQAIIKHYQNSSTTLGGLPAIKIVSFIFGAFTQKTMQVWAFVPTRHLVIEFIYIVQPPQYPLYLAGFQKMTDSVKIAH